MKTAKERCYSSLFSRFLNKSSRFTKANSFTNLLEGFFSILNSDSGVL